MKTRSVHATKTGDNTLRVRLRIEDVPSMGDSSIAHERQRALLQSLLDQPALMNCGSVPFQKMRMFHSGTAWVIEAEAEVFEPSA